MISVLLYSLTEHRILHFTKWTPFNEQVTIRMISATERSFYEQMNVAVRGEMNLPVVMQHLPQEAIIIEASNEKGGFDTSRNQMIPHRTLEQADFDSWPNRE